MSEATRWEPKRAATFKSVKGAGPMSMTATHTFEPNGQRTRYTWSIEFTGPWPVPVVGARLFGRAIDAQQRTLAAYLTEPV